MAQGTQFGISKAAIRRAHRYVKMLVRVFDFGYQAVLGAETVSAEVRKLVAKPLVANLGSEEVSQALLSLKRVNEHMALHGSGQRAIDAYYVAAYDLGVDPGDIDVQAHWLKAGRRRSAQVPSAPAMSTEPAVKAAILDMVCVDMQGLQDAVGGLVVTTSEKLGAVLDQRRKQAFDRWFEGSKAVSAIGNCGSYDNTNPDILLSIANETSRSYDARIDELFSGSKASLTGVRVLERSDVLGLLGHGSKPVVLAEGKVLAGRSNHPRMTADIWKKVPQWLDDPAAVFTSETEGGLVFIAPEPLHGVPVCIIVRPEAGHPSTLQAHLLLNAYDRTTMTPFSRWIEDGLLRYVHKTKFPALLKNTSGRQLPGTAFINKPGTSAILSEKNLAGYRRANEANAPSRAQAWHDASTNTTVFLADRIPAGREASVFLHEIVHRHGRSALPEGRFEHLVDQVKAWADRGGVEREIHDAAQRRVATARVTGAAADEELFAYAVEEAVARGVQPSAAAVTGSAEQWLQAVVESIQRIGEKLIGNDLQGLDGQDLVDLAYAMAQVERPEHAPVVKQALQEALQGAVPAPQQGLDGNTGPDGP